MKKKIELFENEKIKIISVVSYIFITIVIIIMLFPHERKFKYEYKTGSPWKYETLIAQNDFPVYKSPEELNSEKDSIIKQFKPYLKYDSEVKNQSIELFINDFDKEINIITENLNDKKNNYKILDSLKSIKKQTINILNEIYNVGIIYKSYPPSLNASSPVILIKNKVGDEYIINDFYTQKRAYKMFNDKYEKICAKQKFITPLISYQKYLQPNVSYDAQSSEKEKNQLLNQISPARGMIQAGEAIVFQGEIINLEKFNILESFKNEYIQTYGNSIHQFSTIIGEFVLLALLFGVLFLYIHLFNTEILKSNKQTLYILVSMLMPISIYAFFMKFEILNIYIIPEVILAIITVTFYKPRLAFIHNTLTIFIISIFLTNSFEFLLIQLVASFAAISRLSELNSRSQILKTTLVILLSYILAYTAFTLIYAGKINETDYQNYIWFTINSILVLMAYPLIYLFEKLFGFISDVTLLELSNTNKPLLRMLAEKAPGTFQHSVQVANIAEEAVRQIGGNPLLIRAGALYHDIGKTKNPIFFTENQNTGKNPHDKIDTLKSVEIILEHINYGIETARKNKLPKEIIDFIATHQGTGKIRWFLQAYKDKNPDTEIDESLFQYPGPKPHSKETAVLMMSDSVEAASRSLKEHDQKSIDKLVETIINYQINEHQFDYVDLTFAEITKIKTVIKEKLKNIYHTRIEYPK